MSKAYHAPERGAQLFKKCSEETLDDRCTFAYATALETGQGVPIDLVRAAAFYRLANEAKPAQGKLERLVGVEFAIPKALAGGEPPTFLGNTFQSEDEFGVFALHAWVWRNNPKGLFAETNPRVSCGGA